MKLISKLIFLFVANALALFASDYFIEGFSVSKELKGFITVTVILTLVNLIIRPIAKLVLSPLIIITLGLFTFVINAGILYIIDVYFNEITIVGLTALLIATIVIGAVNGLLKLVGKII